MGIIEAVSGGITLFLAGGGLGSRLTDWLRERDARNHDAEEEDDKTAQGILQRQVDELRNKLSELEAGLSRQRERSRRMELRLRLKIRDLETKVSQLEEERDALRAAQLEALERERILQENLEKLKAKQERTQL